MCNEPPSDGHAADVWTVDTLRNTFAKHPLLVWTFTKNYPA